MRHVAIATIAMLTLCLTPGWAEAQTLLERFEQRLRRGAEAASEITPRTSDGSRSRGASLGVRVEPLTTAAMEQYDLQVRQGALVTRVSPNSPAAKAKIPVGSLIVSMDGVRINSPQDVVRLVQASRPGQEIGPGGYPIGLPDAVDRDPKCHCPTVLRILFLGDQPFADQRRHRVRGCRAGDPETVRDLGQPLRPPARSQQSQDVALGRSQPLRLRTLPGMAAHCRADLAESNGDPDSA